MTREALLKASIQEYEDFENNTIVYPAKRILTKSGFQYLIKNTEEAKKISCAIHYTRSFDTSESIGRYENQEISLNTREQIDFLSVLEYKGFLIALTSKGEYNETMKHFHYNGVGAFTPISKQFFITTEAEVEENIGVNSMPFLLELQNEVPYYPSFFQVEDDVKKYVMVDAENAEDLAPVRLNYKGDYEQPKTDEIILTFVNFTRDECLKEISRIQKISVSPYAKFGFLSTFNLVTADTYQISFNWKSLTYRAKAKINYCLMSSKEKRETIKKIKEVIFKNLAIG